MTRFRFAALTLVAGWLAAGALDAYHLAQAPHVACLEHGDVVEGALDHEELDAGIAAGEHGNAHHHCDSSLLQLSSASLASPAIARLVLSWFSAPARTTLSAAFVDEQPWLQAPKQSPPHC